LLGPTLSLTNKGRNNQVMSTSLTIANATNHQNNLKRSDIYEENFLDIADHWSNPHPHYRYAGSIGRQESSEQRCVRY